MMVEIDKMDFCGELCNFAEELIEKAKPKWIPVKERLPERSGFYLVCTVHNFYKTANIAKAHFRSGGFYGQGGHWPNVTHWMPLPELPKEV